jgi:hypothetical protein
MKRVTDKISNSIELLDVYVAPLFLLCLGIIFIVLTFTASIPKPADLSEVRGHLESYYFNQWGRGHGDYNTILILEEGSRFWTDVLNKDTAKSILNERGSEIRLYVESNSTNVPIDGAVKSYGLWVNGQEIESLDAAFGREKFIVRFCFPALGIFSIAVAYFIHRRNKAKYER